MEPVVDEYVISIRGMSAARDYAEQITYKRLIGKSGKAFLIPDPEVPDMGGRIYVTDSEDWDKKGQGFGGGTIKLPLSTGDVFELKGGWHTNPQHLLHDTGVDLSQRNVTFVVISRAAEYNVQRTDPESGVTFTTTVMRDIVYRDPDEGLEGYFMRGKHIAVALVQKRQEALFEYRSSHGGSSFGRVRLEDTVRDPEDMW